MSKQIKESDENDKVLSQYLAIKIKESRYNSSLAKVCDDLGLKNYD